MLPTGRNSTPGVLDFILISKKEVEHLQTLRTATESRLFIIMDFKVTLLLFLCLLKIITCSKYAESANLSEQERPFRMAKVNMLWEKAKKV